MAEVSALRRTPLVMRGALVPFQEAGPVFFPRIIPFQYNPEKVSRAYQPFSAKSSEPSEENQTVSFSQPVDPTETITMTIDLDATDFLEDNDPIAREFGIDDKIASIEQLVFPADSIVGTVLALAGIPRRAEAPVTLLVFGVGRLVPVRVTGLTINENFYLPSLRPTQATVDLTMEVITANNIDIEAIIRRPVLGLALATYLRHRVQRVGLATLNTLTDPALRSLLPPPGGN